MSNLTPTSTPNRGAVRLASVLRAAGWEIEYVDLDLTGDHARAEIKVMRLDGRWLLARVDQIGRASITRYHRDIVLGRTAGTKGRIPLSPQVNDQFLGRDRFEGARSMLRGLTSYIADNSINPVSLSDIRSGWAEIMSAPVHIEHQPHYDA